MAEAAKLRAARAADPVTAATKASRCSLAHRIQVLDAELVELNEQIVSLLLATAPELMARFGVGLDTARARTPVTYAGTTGKTARPTARCGESPWWGSRTTPRPPTTSSDG